MEMEHLLALLDSVGDSRIIGFIMDNSSRLYFRDTMLFDRKKHLDHATQCIVMQDIDTAGFEYYVYKPTNTIQSVLVSDKSGEISKYSTRYIGC